MDQVAKALGDAARWRMVELLAEHPRSVGELAELTGLRQPQTTKHLQTLARAGLVAVFRLGQRRVYALETPALQQLEHRLHELIEAAAAHAGDRDVIARYRAAIETEAADAAHDGWADGRTFTFDRVMEAAPEVVWQHWVDPELLGTWWAPASLVVSRCALVPRRGGRALLEYRDTEGQTYLSEGRVRAAKKPARLAFDLSVLGLDREPLFTGQYDVRLDAAPEGTRLRVELRLGRTTVAAVPAIAGIQQGWQQTLDQLAAAVGAARRTRSTPRRRTHRKEDR